jgi:AcrR family transcriptional regulator
MSPQNKSSKKTRKMFKEEQLQLILKTARELYLESGSDGFSLRKVAQKLKMAPSNMYNYFEDKRELWFAMLNEEYYNDVISELRKIDTLEISFTEKWKLVVDSYLKTAFRDIKRYLMMFDAIPPKGKNPDPGPYELQFRPISYEILIDMINQAIKKKEINELSPYVFGLYLYSRLSGAVKSIIMGIDIGIIKFDAEILDYYKLKLCLLA